MQWPLTSQLHGSVSQREQLVFIYGSNSMPGDPDFLLQFLSGFLCLKGYSHVTSNFVSDDTKFVSSDQIFVFRVNAPLRKNSHLANVAA
jgi:hypothetical protein